MKIKKKKVGIAILACDKEGFKTKAIKRDSEEQYRILKGLILQEDIALVSIYAPNRGAYKYIKYSCWILRKILTTILS